MGLDTSRRSTLAGCPVGLRSSRAFLQAVNVGETEKARELGQRLND
jgi:hypothetical protein